MNVGRERTIVEVFKKQTCFLSVYFGIAQILITIPKSQQLNEVIFFFYISN